MYHFAKFKSLSDKLNRSGSTLLVKYGQFFLFKHLVKFMMTDSLNPSWESFFVNFVATRGQRLTKVLGFGSTTLRFPYLKNQ